MDRNALDAWPHLMGMFDDTGVWPHQLILGEAAGVAAALAISGRTSLQGVDYALLRTRLLERGARLDRPEAEAPRRPPSGK